MPQSIVGDTYPTFLRNWNAEKEAEKSGKRLRQELLVKEDKLQELTKAWEDFLVITGHRCCWKRNLYLLYKKQKKTL